MADKEIVVVLPEGAQCEGTPAEEWGLDVKCIVPMQNEPVWHDVYSGHLARVLVDGEAVRYLTWWGDAEPMLRPDIVDPKGQ